MTAAVTSAMGRWAREVVAAWDRFWFTPSDPATLCLLRIGTGAMLFYTHLVWGFELSGFFGPNAWISVSMYDTLTADSFVWSIFSTLESPTALWAFHIAALVIFALLTVGLFSRVVAVLAYLCTLSYMHRAIGANFGLDQINVMLALYLMIGPSGARYSLDSVWQRQRGRAGEGGADREHAPPRIAPSISANVAIRLIQLHMCIIYFFAGTRKLMGTAWWDGSAMWISLANAEYQTLDLTWLASWPVAISFLSHLTVFWEISYAFLVWPRLSRPVVLLLAVVMHLGIAVCLGMATFGLAMLIGNLAFVSPALIRSLFDRRKQQEAAAAGA